MTTQVIIHPEGSTPERPQDLRATPSKKASPATWSRHRTVPPT